MSTHKWSGFVLLQIQCLLLTQLVSFYKISSRNIIITHMWQELTCEPNVANIPVFGSGPTFPGLDRGGYLPSGWGGGYLPSQVGYLPGGYPPHLGRYPHHQGRYPPTMVGTPPPHQNSIACACYVVGGMPLAFTQEDFLVTIKYWRVVTFCT